MRQLVCFAALFALMALGLAGFSGTPAGAAAPSGSRHPVVSPTLGPTSPATGTAAWTAAATISGATLSSSPTPAVSPTSATPAAPRTNPTPTATLLVGDRPVVAKDVQKVFGTEPIALAEHEVLIEGRLVKYYDITFERLGRKARMIGQVPATIALDGVSAPARVEGFAAYFQTETVSLAIPLLWPPTKYSLPAVPVLLGVMPDSSEPGSEGAADWRIGLFDQNTGERLAYYGGNRQLHRNDPLVFDLSSGQFSVCSAFPCGRAYVSAPPRIGMQVFEATARKDIRFLRMSPEDVAYFDNTLALLQVKAPRWWQYIIDGEPFVAVLDPSLAAMGWSGAGSRCSADGYGWVAWIQPLAAPTWPFTVEGMRVNFWATLVHEMTHVRDLREHRFGDGVEGCRALERSALTKELELAQDLLSAKLNEPDESRSSYTQAIDAIIVQRKKELREGAFDWDPQCRQD